MSDIIIKAEKLTKVFEMPAEEIRAVDGVDLEINRGDFISLMGPSGSGKTTLLDVIGCLDSISSGSLALFGEDVSTATESELVKVRRNHIGFVFQEFLLLPELTAIENVETPLVFARKPIDRQKTLAIMDKVGLWARTGHLPKELSGGERQRVAVARALAGSPELLMADEPTGNLDTKNSEEMFALLCKLNEEEGLTIVMATHDQDLGSRTKRVLNLIDGKLSGTQ